MDDIDVEHFTKQIDEVEKAASFHLGFSLFTFLILMVVTVVSGCEKDKIRDRLTILEKMHGIGVVPEPTHPPLHTEPPK